MKNFKKLLSIILSVSFLLTSTLSLSAFADVDPLKHEVYCSYQEKNSKGGYVDFNNLCDPDLKNVWLYKTADFADANNLGRFGNHENIMFNFRGLDEFYEKKKLVPTKDLEDQYNLLDKKCEDLSHINWNKENIFKVTFGGLATSGLFGTIASLFTFKKSQKPTSSQSEKSIPNQSSQDSKSEPTSKNSHSVVKTVLLTLLSGLVGGLATIIGLKIKSEKPREDICQQRKDVKQKFKKILKANVENEQMIEDICNLLEHPNLMSDLNNELNDMFVCLTQDEHEGDETKVRNFLCRSKKAANGGINYTKEEIESLPQKFREMAAKIRMNLEGEGELSSQDNTFQEENCVNCKQLEN